VSARRERMPLALLSASLAAGAGALAVSGGPLRWVLGAALALVLPGAAITALLGSGLAAVDRVFATIACSIAVAILAGLAIGAGHGGFDAAAWIAILAGVAVALSGLALLRDRSSGAEPNGAARRTLSPRGLRLPAGGTTLACYAAAAAIVLAAVVMAHRSAGRTSERASLIANGAPQPSLPAATSAAARQAVSAGSRP